jgi:proteasome lid subunit RPN8/RPN11
MQVAATVAALSEIRRLAALAYPDEGCGVLVGAVEGGVTCVDAAHGGRNLRTDRARDRYELDPGDILRVERLARAAGADVVGFWHSHPDHPARPSGFDTERAWTDYVYVIISTTPSGTADLRAWMLDADGGPFSELPVVAVDG